MCQAMDGSLSVDRSNGGQAAEVWPVTNDESRAVHAD